MNVFLLPEQGGYPVQGLMNPLYIEWFDDIIKGVEFKRFGHVLLMGGGKNNNCLGVYILDPFSAFHPV